MEFLNHILESITVASGEIPLLKKKFSLREALEQIIRLNQSQATVKNLSLNLDYDKRIPASLIGDPVRVQRIILELLTNALKFTDKGEIKVSTGLMKEETHPERIIIKRGVAMLMKNFGHPVPKIHSPNATEISCDSSGVRHALAHSGRRAVASTMTLRRDAFPASPVNARLSQALQLRIASAMLSLSHRLSVSDTGIGIPRDKQPEVYTRFKRLTPAYQGIYPGTGLGLSVVKQFMDDLEGEIYLESELGKGSEFVCLIPFQKPLLMDATGIESTEPFVINNKVSLKNPLVNELATSKISITQGSHVLLVEDQAIAAKIAKSVLSELDCQVDIAVDGKTALERIEKSHYDLVLMDVGLPDNDGYEVTRRIRLKQWQRNTSVPIVGLTAHISAEKKRNCLDQGMNAIYMKPLTPVKASEIVNVFIPHHPKTASSSIIKDLSILDINSAIQLMGNKEFVKEGLILLVNSLREELEIIKQRHQEKDWQAIKALAHKWRGGAIYCGTQRLEKACQQLEAYLQTGSLEQAEDFYQQLIKEAEAAKDAAEKYIT